MPDEAKNEELREMAVYFSNMVRAVDSSLLEDWEKMRAGGVLAAVMPELAEIDDRPRPKSEAELTRVVRNGVHAFLRALSVRDVDGALAIINDGEKKWAVGDIEKVMKEYHADHSRIRTDPKARLPQYTTIHKDSKKSWRVEQVILDPLERNDWMASFLSLIHI